MWMAPGEIVPDRKRQTVQSPKLTLTIAWNPSGCHIVKALPKGGKFSAQYYTNNIHITANIAVNTNVKASVTITINLNINLNINVNISP
jgi:hypothetical protein